MHPYYSRGQDLTRLLHTQEGTVLYWNHLPDQRLLPRIPQTNYIDADRASAMIWEKYWRVLCLQEQALRLQIERDTTALRYVA